MKYDKDSSWRDKAFEQSSKLQPGVGQEEARASVPQEAIEELKKFFPDEGERITPATYDLYMRKFLSRSKRA